MSVAHTMIACAAALMLVAGSGPVLGPVMAQSEAETEVQVETPDPPEQDAETEVVAGATLYQRVGGYDAIAEMVDDFFERMGEDESLQRFFIGQSESSMRRIRQHTVDFLCERTGGPCFFTGRDMAAVHEGTGITEADWERATELMAETMDANGLMGELRDEVGRFIASLEDDIVEEE
jgi:hemoglobin